MAGVSRELRAERVRYWQSLIEEQSQSGLSVLEFCRAREVAATSFYQWRAKLQNESGPSAARLVPVKLINPAEQPKPAVKSCIQLLLPSGVALTVTGAVGEEDLVKLLRAIDTFEANRSC